ncbi:MAG: TatD family hydrolase [Candidatus Helarchaeota archaeon]
MYVDVHCHLVQYSNVKEIITRSKEKNVIIVSVSMDLQDNLKNIQLLDEKQVKIMLGIHPMKIGTRKFKASNNEKVFDLIKLHKDKIVGIGEIGLDASMHPKYFEKQEKYLISYLELAEELKLGITLHGRRAQPRLFEILKNFDIRPTVIHWYYGSDDLIDEGVSRGYYFSITPAIFYSPHRKVVEKVPLDRLMTESDGPCQFKHLNRSSFPIDVIDTIKEIARIKELDLTLVENVIFKTSSRLYL